MRMPDVDSSCCEGHNDQVALPLPLPRRLDDAASA